VRPFVTSNSQSKCDLAAVARTFPLKQKRLRFRSRLSVDRLRVTSDAKDYFFFFGAAFFFAAAFFAAIGCFSLIEICDSEKSQCDSYIELSTKKVKKKMHRSSASLHCHSITTSRTRHHRFS
jgi:hypothetical protein